MAGAGNGGHLRASHADRERVIGILKAAFVQGRLDKEEFDLRVSRAFASRTYAELAAVTADMPAGLGPAQPPAPVRAQGEKPILRPGPVMMGATAIWASVWGVALLTVKGDNRVVSFLVVAITLTYFLVLLIAGGHMLASWHQKRSGRQLPPGAVSVQLAGVVGLQSSASPGGSLITCPCAKATSRTALMNSRSLRDRTGLGSSARNTRQSTSPFR